ncbi:MAG TPA: hypothetical protein VGQ56_16250 [Gemmatimonadaceae bacterium]|jgi:hypothetical protein|nr:hypothetical protein [Gemmatimonadaceae bacterium]
MTLDPHAALRDAVLDGVLQGPGESDSFIRVAVAAGADDPGVPADLKTLIEKIDKHAYKVSDDDVARLQGVYGDDQMFEIIVSAALGASRRRLLAGLAALDDA